MSTKIYNAYRLLPNINFFTLIPEIQLKASKKAYEILNEELVRYKGNISILSEEFLEKQAQLDLNWEHKLSKTNLEKFTLHNLASKLMDDGYAESTKSMVRSPFDYNATITFRFLEGKVYAQTYTDFYMNPVFSGFTRAPYMTDYHYQNQCDKPKSVTNRDWDERKRVWDKLYENDLGRKTYLSLEVMNRSEYLYWTIHRDTNFMKPIHAEYARKQS